MRYKIGDRVITTKDIDCNNIEVFPIGTIGIISGINDIETLPYQISIEDGDNWNYSEDMFELYAFKTYEDGLNDAWEVAKEICTMHIEDLKSVFPEECSYGIVSGNILCGYTPQQALTKIEAYKERKVIKVGDVIEISGNTAVVASFGTYDVKDDSIHVIFSNGVVNSFRKNDKSIKKTGRYIDVTSILKQIKGNE